MSSQKEDPKESGSKATRMSASDTNDKGLGMSRKNQDLEGDRQHESSDKSSKEGAKNAPEVPKEQGFRKKIRVKKDGLENKQSGGWFSRIGNLTSSALRIARKTTDGSVKVGKSILKSQDQLKLMVVAGHSLKDLREVAGLTVTELGDAINLKDRTFWEAVEDGTATISFELILRLAALLARNDPVPFILKYTRTYNPDLWRILNDWGLGRLPLHYEREREFINIYRRHDAARNLSDEGFAKVLSFTRQSFEMALHFAAEQEQITVSRLKEAEQRKAEESKTAAESTVRSGTSQSAENDSGSQKGDTTSEGVPSQSSKKD